MDPSQIESLVSFAASHSPHHRTRVGAVLILPSGNQAFFGHNHPNGATSSDAWAHAEAHAIYLCLAANHSPQDGTLLVNWFPCLRCAKHIVRAQIATVYYHHLSSIARWADPDYRFHEANVLLRVGGVKLIPY